MVLSLVPSSFLFFSKTTFFKTYSIFGKHFRIDYGEFCETAKSLSGSFEEKVD